MALRTIFAPTLLAALTALGALATGCASDPSKQVKTARDDEAEIVRARQERTAEHRKDQRQDHAEARRDVSDDRADNQPRGTKEREKAEAKMTEAREKYRNDAAARLEKASARLMEAQKKLDNAGSRANLDVKNRVDTAAQQRTAVSQQLTQLSMVKDEQWEATTKTVDKRLDELEALLDVAIEKTDNL